METYTLKRVYLATSTPGSIYNSLGELVCKTLELPDKQNQRRISCIPEGTYKVVKEPPKPTRNHGHFRILNVPNRDGILMHRITYVKDLLGCIGIGSRHVDLNGDGIPDIVESSTKLEWMYVNLPQEFYIKIE
jgi:hypothetical protein